MSGEDARRVGGSDEPLVQRLARSLARVDRGSVRAVVLYGSRLVGATPDRHSAVDFVVVVEDYGGFYEGLAAAGALHRPVWLMAALARVLPPNVIAFATEDEAAGIAKCLVVSAAHFERALGPDPPDHLLLGRMIQQVDVVWTAGPEAAAWVDECLAEARGAVLSWMAPYLEGSFDAGELGRRALEVCYSGELRPEAVDRAAHIFDVQVAHFRSAFGPVLERQAAAGFLRRTGGMYELAEPVTADVRRRWRRHFRRSKLRATARWLKHTVTFANWLPYVERKVRRRTGRTAKLTALERKLPLIFLWPRAVLVLLTRPARQDDAPGDEAAAPRSPAGRPTGGTPEAPPPSGDPPDGRSRGPDPEDDT